VISMLLAVVLAIPSYNVERKMTPARVRAKAHQIVQMLKRQDPRVLRSVMYYMKWVPKLEFKREKSPVPCKKDNRKTQLDKLNEWELNMLLDMAGIPRKKR
jgi:hypothetical protein